MLVYSPRKIAATITLVFLFSVSPIVIGAVATDHKSGTLTPQSSASSSLGIVIPLYIYPGSSSWSSVIQAKQTYENVPFIAVINPSSGPGSAFDSRYLAGIQQLQAAGIVVLGYVPTHYAQANITLVENETETYNSWYHVNGIFFDEMSNALSNESYYASLNTYVHNLGIMNLTMGNPGAVVPSSEAGILNILNVYENGGLPNLTGLSYSGSPSSDFSLMAYNLPNLNTTFLESAAGYVGYLYLTNATLPNPYDILPSYFTAEVASLSTIDSSLSSLGTPSPTSSSSSSSSATTMLTDSTMMTRILSSSATSATTTDITRTATTSTTFYAKTSSTVIITTTTSTTKSTPALATITVESVSDGSSFRGMHTLVQSANGAIVDSGFTPLVYQGIIGARYTVTIDNYEKYVFANWNDGSTNPSQSLNLSSNLVLTAYFRTTSTLKVMSMNFLGNPISGYYTQLYDSSSGTIVNGGFTPTSYTVTNGVAYRIQAESYGPCTFSHWSDGSTSNPTSISISSSTTITAVYSGTSCGPTTSTISVSTVNSKGGAIYGYYIELLQNGVQIGHCFSKCSFNVNDGQTYQVHASSYGSESFNHWANDGQTKAETVNVPSSGATIDLSAVYSP